MKPSLGDVIAEKYRLDRVLGEGGMSTVFAAVNVMTGKQVAIKWLNPEVVHDDELCQRLLREAKATSAIDHPNVVNVFDVGTHFHGGQGALFLVMELLYGEPLSTLLTRYEPTQTIAPDGFVRLMMPVLRGVHAAHRVGVVHRDLKPDNIFLCRDPHDDGELREPKVLDFGISKLVDKSMELGKELTREGTVFGTPQYMAPEQMRDARVADVRSDVYALGVIFYRALSKRYPYDADTLSALAIRVVEGNAPALHEVCPHVDIGLSDIIMRALAVDPEQRMQSVAALAHALEPYARGTAFTRSLPGEAAAGWQLDAADVDESGAHPIVVGRVPVTPSAVRAPLFDEDLYVDDAPTEALTLEDIILELDPEHREAARQSFGRRADTPAPANDHDTRTSGPPTLRTDRFWTRTRKRRALVIGVVLFAIGAAAPVALQRDEKPEPPPSKAEQGHDPDGRRSARVPSFALAPTETAGGADLTAVTTTPIGRTAEPDIDTPLTLSTPLEMERRRRSRGDGVQPEAQAAVSDAATAHASAPEAELAEDRTIPVEDAVPTLRRERNPYLAR
ncbi:MAG: protein kinase [Polyangiales bacterium]